MCIYLVLKVYMCIYVCALAHKLLWNEYVGKQLCTVWARTYARRKKESRKTAADAATRERGTGREVSPGSWKNCWGMINISSSSLKYVRHLVILHLFCTHYEMLSSPSYFSLHDCCVSKAICEWQPSGLLILFHTVEARMFAFI